MRRLRKVAPITAGAGWIGLHVYAGHPLIAAAAAHPFVGWGIVLTAPAISILPMLVIGHAPWNGPLMKKCERRSSKFEWTSGRAGQFALRTSNFLLIGPAT